MYPSRRMRTGGHRRSPCSRGSRQLVRRLARCFIMKASTEASPIGVMWPPMLGWYRRRGTFGLTGILVSPWRGLRNSMSFAPAMVCSEPGQKPA